MRTIRTALAAMIFDSQFIIIQRYNRPRIIKVLERSKKEIKKKTNIKELEKKLASYREMRRKTEIGDIYGRKV